MLIRRMAGRIQRSVALANRLEVAAHVVGAVHRSLSPSGSNPGQGSLRDVYCQARRLIRTLRTVKRRNLIWPYYKHGFSSFTHTTHTDNRVSFRYKDKSARWRRTGAGGARVQAGLHLPGLRRPLHVDASAMLHRLRSMRLAAVVQEIHRPEGGV